MDRYTRELIDFGKGVKRVRKKLKLTQLDLEVKSGINHADISRIENGQTNIEFQTIVKLADAMEVELFEFFHKTSNKEA